MIVEVASSPAERRSRLDVYLAIALGAAAVWMALWYLPLYRAAGVSPPLFFQREFAPAVMQACGRGFVNADPAGAPRLRAFLDQQAGQLPCADVPGSIRVIPLDAFQATSRTLMGATALVWRMTGVRWQSVDLLLGAMFGTAIMGSYATMRFVSGRALSLLVVALWASSPRHLHNLPHLRDYSKVPFFVLMLLATAVAFVERRPRQLIALGTAFGVAQGIGFGMRTDVFLNFIPFLTVLFVGARDGLSHNLAAKLACAAAAVVAFLLVAYPTNRAYADSSNIWHITVLGLSAPQDESMNLNMSLPGPAYSFPYAYDDTYVTAVVHSDWARRHPGAAPVGTFTRAYRDACREYFVRLARTFPGDIVARMIASALRVADLPFDSGQGRVPRGITTPPLVSALDWRASVMEMCRGLGLWMLAGVLVLIGTRSLRYLLLASLLLFAWASHPFIEFQDRHVFQHEFLVLAFIAWGCSLLWRSIREISREGEAFEFGARALKPLATMAGLFAAAAIVLTGARAIQQGSARLLLTSYDRATIVPLQPRADAMGDGQERLAVDVFGAAAVHEDVQEQMVEADFAPDRCGDSSTVAATFRYQAGDSGSGRADLLSRTVSVPLRPGSARPTRVFLPVYAWSHDGSITFGFAGVEVPSNMSACVRLARVRDLAAFPVLLPAVLTPDWTNGTLYQRLHLDEALPPVVRHWIYLHVPSAGWLWSA